ncbi:unnamed protein product, partial [Amoebophrya sp. A120]
RPDEKRRNKKRKKITGERLATALFQCSFGHQPLLLRKRDFPQVQLGVNVKDGYYLQRGDLVVHTHAITGEVLLVAVFFGFHNFLRSESESENREAAVDSSSSPTYDHSGATTTGADDGSCAR